MLRGRNREWFLPNRRRSVLSSAQHTQITLDVYTQAVNSNKRAALSKVVKMMVSSEGTKVAGLGTTDSTKQAQNAG
jgi:hypothetical protein